MLPPWLLKPPIAITGSPPVASSSHAADCEPSVAATQRYWPAPASSARFRAADTVACPPNRPPPLAGAPVGRAPGTPRNPPALASPAEGTDPVWEVVAVWPA